MRQYKKLNLSLFRLQIDIFSPVTLFLLLSVGISPAYAAVPNSPSNQIRGFRFRRCG